MAARSLLALLNTNRRAVVAAVIVVAALAAADPSVASLLVGATISITGEALRIVTAGYGYKVGEHSLRGPYRFVRHPYFLGSAMLFVGLCVAGRNPYVTGGAMLALAMLFVSEVAVDDQKLQTRLGPAFADYKAKVPAFLPQVYPYRGGWPAGVAGRNFSLSLSLFTGRHREFNALLGLAFALLFFYAVLQVAAPRAYFRVAVLAAAGVYGLARVGFYTLGQRRKT